jgi:hypothetical protein
MKTILTCAALAATIAMPRSAHAQRDRPLPPFTVTNAAGARVAGTQLTSAAQWLLVYAPDSVAGERLVGAVGQWASGSEAQIVIVVAAPSAVIDARIRPLLPTASATIGVFADPDGAVSAALSLTSAPALVGVANGGVNWIVQGVLNDPSMVEPLVRAWLHP